MILKFCKGSFRLVQNWDFIETDPEEQATLYNKIIKAPDVTEVNVNGGFAAISRTI